MQFPGLVVALAYDRLCLFEFGIAVELFGLERPEIDGPWYSFKVAGLSTQPCTALGDVQITARGGLSLLKQASTIIIPGWNRAIPPSPQLIGGLRKAYERGARLLSICSGAFLLGETGLLDGKQATTHWRYATAFRTQFPAVELIPDVLYVDAGQLITSAGSAAGLDAGLHLIRRDFGVTIANTVARRLVIAPHRDGGQRQFIPAPILSTAHAPFESVMAWAQARLDRPLTLSDLAKHAAMSPRNFLRRFAAHTGTTPKAWLQRARIARAQELIERGTLPLQRVAERSGFASPETFRAVFRKYVGVSPAAYRQRFRAAKA
jgi:AraC family transcriptional regulator, transcriptional activator FtrA